jgi:poly-D-alanine transfer protein DltD
MRPKRVEMISQTISLRQVNVTATKEAFDPHKEYPEVYTKSKVSVMSPSTWFSKEGKDARRLKSYFQRLEQEDEIDNAFTVEYVKSVVPLRGAELENFMSMYRPSYAF